MSRLINFSFNALLGLSGQAYEDFLNSLYERQEVKIDIPEDDKSSSIVEYFQLNKSNGINKSDHYKRGLPENILDKINLLNSKLSTILEENFFHGHEYEDQGNISGIDCAEILDHMEEQLILLDKFTKQGNPHNI